MITPPLSSCDHHATTAMRSSRHNNYFVWKARSGPSTEQKLNGWNTTSHMALPSYRKVSTALINGPGPS
jgi:hypothetical protein